MNDKAQKRNANTPTVIGTTIPVNDKAKKRDEITPTVIGTTIPMNDKAQKRDANRPKRIYGSKLFFKGPDPRKNLV